MGLRDWLRAAKPRSARAEAPSAEHATPLEAIHALLTLDDEAGDDGLWVTLVADHAGRECVIEVAQETLNFCTEPLDLDRILPQAGLARLAPGASPSDKHRTLWELRGAAADERALLVHHVFTQWLGTEAYRLKGERHQ